MSDVASLLERANARAATLLNLKKSYGASKSASNNVNSAAGSHAPAARANTSNTNMASTASHTAPSSGDKKQQPPILARARGKGALDMLLSVVGGGDEPRTRRFFSEQLDGKSIVLTNTTKQMRATSASSRGKAHVRRQKRATDAVLERAGVLDSYASPCTADLRIAYNLWLKFVWGVVDSCSSEAQLQARLSSAGLLGAKVSVRGTASQRVNKGKRGRGSSGNDELIGYVCSESKNCIYVAIGCDDCGVDSTDGSRKRQRMSEHAGAAVAGGSADGRPSPAVVQVRRILRAYSEILVYLPASKSGGSHVDRVCVFRGVKYAD